MKKKLNTKLLKNIKYKNIQKQKIGAKKILYTRSHWFSKKLTLDFDLLK